MHSSRRHLLLGLGGLVTAAGAVLSTGAFDTVEAERSVTVETAGDAAALLGIEPADGASEFAEITDGTVEIDISTTEEGAAGINQNAITVINPILEVTNNGSREVSLGFDDDLVVERETTFDENPTGWAYAGDSDAHAILWGPYDPDAEFDPIEPGNLNTGGQGSPFANGLVNSRFTYTGFEGEDDRRAVPGETLSIGMTINTRDLADDPPAGFDETFVLTAESI